MADQTESTTVAVTPDVGPFAQIGCALNTNGSQERWVAPSYASPLAFYIVMQRKSLTNYLAGGMVGGAIGGAIRGFFGPGVTAAGTCSVSDLPDAVRHAIDPSGAYSSHDVIVLPRQSVGYVKFVGFWMFAVSVDLTVGNRKFLLATGIFQGRRIKRELARLKWLPRA